ncbi:MAG: helix-turn-helix domain-containing protein [Candidatus Binataceae bacterium]
MRKRIVSNVTFGSSIKNQRTVLGLTQRELANELGVKASYISYLEKDQRRPSISVLSRLGEVLGLARAELLMLAYPETRDIVDGAQGRAPKKRRNVWKEFSGNRALIRQHHISAAEMGALRRINMMGNVANPRDLLFVLAAIRQALAKEAV